VRDLVNMYGSSESGTIAVTSPGDRPDVRLGSLGRPTPGTVASIRDDSGGEVPDGAVGELWLRGPMSMLGYLDADGRPVPPIDGWIHTGDLVIRDADGVLRYAGRADDRLKPGGENVSIAEVEQFLLGDDRIQEVVVVGVPDRRLGDVPAAVVRLADGVGAAGAAEEIIARCRRSIAGFKVPRHVRVVNRLPVLDTGKIDRRRVRAELLEHLGEGTGEQS
jgi:acyl-CoA synthetase (AMP-forming)/AMP-acid ligase II